MSYNPGSDIVQAFQAGAQKKLEIAKLAQDKELRQRELDLRHQELDQQQQQFQHRMDFEKSVQDITNTIARNKILADARETGEVPVDSTILPQAQPQSSPIPTQLNGTAPQTNNVSPDPEHITFLNKLFGNSPVTIKTPEAEATEKANLGLIANAPLLARAAAAEKAKQEAELALEGAKSESAKAIAQMQIDAAEKEKEATNKTAIQVAQIRSKGKLNPLDRPLSAVEQRDVFGLDKYDPTLTPATAGKLKLTKPLTPAQDSQVSTFNILEDKISALKNILESNNDSGYHAFYRGPLAGAQAEMQRSGTTDRDPLVEDINAKVGDLKNTIAVAAKESKLTPGQMQLLNQYVPTNLMTGSPTTAKANLNNLLTNVRTQRGEFYKSLQKPPANSVAPKLYFDAQGNPTKGPQ